MRERTTGARRAFDNLESDHPGKGREMDLHEVLKFVHVAAAIVWVGGAVTLEIMGLRAGRRADTAGMVAFGKDAEVIGRVYGAATALVLAMGIWMVVDSPAIEFSDAWISIALGLTVIMFLMGPLFFEKHAKAISSLAESKGGDAPEVRSTMGRMMLVARIDSAFAFFIVWLMVVKPGA